MPPLFDPNNRKKRGCWGPRLRAVFVADPAVYSTTHAGCDTASKNPLYRLTEKLNRSSLGAMVYTISVCRPNCVRQRRRRPSDLHPSRRYDRRCRRIRRNADSH